MKRSAVTLLSAALVFMGLVLLPASAGATPASFWVANAVAVSSPGTSCSHPGFSTIQSALSAAPAKATVHVCAGTYAEQLAITKAVTIVTTGAVTVRLPATPADTVTACDTAPGTGAFQPDQDEISVCTTGTVSVSNLTVQADWAAGTCDDSLFGVLVAGGANLAAKNLTISGAGADPINGCQGGVGLQVGMAWTTPVEVGHVSVSGSGISGYQKNGVTIDGKGSTANIATTTVTGAGATPALAQNGIQVSNGAGATISASTISGNECDNAACGSDGLDTQSTGLLFYAAAKGSSVSGSTISGNDDGVYYASASLKEPKTSEVAINNDTFIANRYEAVEFDQGRATVTGGVIKGPGEAGIESIQYAQQAYGPMSTATGVLISGMTVAAVQVDSDQVAGDPPGSFEIIGSGLGGNAARVVDNSSNFTVTQLGDF